MALTRLRTGGIAANAVVAASIAPGAVDITDIADGAVTEAKLAANAVVAAKIANNAVIETKLAANAVTSAKIAAGAVEINNTTIQFASGSSTAPSISVDGDPNTGIFFSATNTVDIATDGVAQAQVNSAGDFAINAGFGSVGKAYLCRAWVNFNGTGTVAIRASGNVSSITDNGTGDYTINFTTAMPDANYAVTGIVGDYGTVNAIRGIMVSSATAPTTSALRIVTCITSAEDQGRVLVSIFR